MTEILKIIIHDWQSLFLAVTSSQKNFLFIFEEVFYVIASLVFLLFLTGLGRKILKMFGRSPSRSPFGHLEGGGTGEELLFSLGLGIIFWGTLVLVLGMLGILYFGVVWGVAGILCLFCGKEMIEVISDIREIRVIRNGDVWKKFFLIFIILNIIGALTPEKGVDAIGYHLYFPKVYLQNHTMMLPGRGSRLFSLFPHLASMIYLLPVSLNMPNIAQLTHMWLGVLTAVTIGLVTGSTTASLLFYSTLVVGSISRSAYSDFFITFFLSLGILVEVGVYKGDKGNKGNKGIRILLAGLMFGGALATKNQSLALIPILITALLFSKGDLVNRLSRLFKILLISFCVPLLWYIRSIIISGNPFYPMFNLKDIRVPQFNFNYYLNFEFLKHVKIILIYQPIFVLLFFLFFIYFFKDKNLRKQIFIGFLVFLYWDLLPDSFHDNRYFLPYFILIILLFSPILENIVKDKLVRLGVLGILGILILPRIYTNSFYLPYVFGFEEKKIFLSNALRERPEDFYDIDSQFSIIIKDKRVLTDNILGLYYIDFPFDEFEYSLFYGKRMTADEFKDGWKKGNYSFLLLKNEKLTDFFAKMGISSDGNNLFQLIENHKLSKTYLYEPSF